MLDWAGWIAIWWGAWFALLLTWYDREKPAPLNWMTVMFMFILSGFAPIGVVVIVIKKALRRDK